MDDAKVREAVDLILAGATGVEVARLCRSSGITYETGRDRRRRERRETVRDGYQLGLPLDEVAGRAGIKPAGLYNHLEGVSLRFPKKARRFHRQRQPQRPRIVVQAPRTIPTVREMFDEGLPLRGISAKLGITLDEARAQLRSSYPDSVDRDIRPLEHRTGPRAEAARAAAG